VASHSILIVGGGSIGERHLRCFLKTGRVRASLCDANPAIVERLRSNYDVAATFADYDAIDLSAYDSVVICTPAQLHIPMARRAVEAGCHVLCEKPLSTSLDGVDELDEAIRRKGVKFVVAYTHRSMPPMEEFRRRIHAGEIGQVKQVFAAWGQHFPTYRPAYRQIYYTDRATGGGALQDAVTHILNFVQWCMGPASSVYCQADHLVLEGVEVEDTAALILRFRDSPAIGTIVLNQFQTNNSGVYEFAGTAGTLRFEMPGWRVGVCKNEQWTWQEPRTFERDEFYIRQAELFLKTVDENAPPVCTLAEAADTLRTILAALQSADEQRSVELGV
jgi:predicted dehydrogenase